jgi:POT family proton-dependent oligopeptide transporter
LEFSYRQAPLRMKSFIMAFFLLAVSVGNVLTAAVNHAMVRPLHAESVETGAHTWVKLDQVHDLVLGQKIDFGSGSGVTVIKDDGKRLPLAGTYLVADIEEPGKRIELMDVVNRKPVASSGSFDAAKAEISTYKLVGPQYFNFFALIMSCAGVLFLFVAAFYRGTTHLRDEAEGAAA